MLKKEIVELINKQINTELYSAYLYYNMASFYSERNLDGFANWFYVQAKEEFTHADKFRTYLHDNDAVCVLETINKPAGNLKDSKDAIVLTVKHEEAITEAINKIYKKALDLDDYSTVQFLHFFIEEQREEEKRVKDLLRRYEMFVQNENSLYLFDQELMKRDV